uniref:Uncharacterized protein n=1 Tax=Chromera velia CCMP2878 TaxID=1169474 RepID=A0A0G4I675_9ALVE|eukprot:Cvel_11322.t1-p1 / transcript=Cvel_11322.t1 / gene=Cvel_11322 / organism=Chromera_velia_CCMP2878 / gene_product=hypothetical protein / transcript_product=hypothetical protein / location=Cvel_scaffold708:44965-45474(-) / protein_length=170 / sequence_SO=supercontig / SO=protein_coding / is_pseudo=false
MTEDAKRTGAVQQFCSLMDACGTFKARLCAAKSASELLDCFEQMWPKGEDWTVLFGEVIDPRRLDKDTTSSWWLKQESQWAIPTKRSQEKVVEAIRKAGGKRLSEGFPSPLFEISIRAKHASAKAVAWHSNATFQTMAELLDFILQKEQYFEIVEHLGRGGRKEAIAIMI